MPCDYANCPKNWRTVIRPRILARAGNCCEGTPAHPDCRAMNRHPHPETGSMVVLTIAHLNHDLACNDDSNLRALCQRCHLRYDAAHHAANAKRTLDAKSGQLPLF